MHVESGVKQTWKKKTTFVHTLKKGFWTVPLPHLVAPLHCIFQYHGPLEISGDLVPPQQQGMIQFSTLSFFFFYPETVGV